MTKRYTIRATLPRGQFVVIDTRNSEPTLLRGSDWDSGKHLRALAEGYWLSGRDAKRCRRYAIVGGVMGSMSLSSAEWLAARMNGESAVAIATRRVRTFENLHERFSDHESQDLRDTLDLLPV